jgi:hypothetical protein
MSSWNIRPSQPRSQAACDPCTSAGGDGGRAADGIDSSQPAGSPAPGSTPNRLAPASAVAAFRLAALASPAARGMQRPATTNRPRASHQARPQRSRNARMSASLPAGVHRMTAAEPPPNTREHCP